MNKKQIIIKNHPDADYQTNADLLAALDEIAKKKENEKNKKPPKPLK